ncbi:MAG: protein kinase, partial [Myxococcota bacterium]
MRLAAHSEIELDRVGAWRLEERLGAGAFGTVWRARDPSGRVAVVKLLPAPPGEEIRALARVRHPSVVEALGAGTVPVPHLVMSLAPGIPLSAVGPVSEAAAAGIVAALADALAACHRGDVAHGDVKPANVVVEPESLASTPRVTLVDFGLAGSLGGTPRYASPERLGGAPASPAADVFALGAVALELVGR